MYLEINEEYVEATLKKFFGPFKLDVAPLARACLIKIEDRRYVFALEMHHIVTDGVSFQILMNEIVELYLGNSLSELKIQYKDYAVWFNELIGTDYIKKQKSYWHFINVLPIKISIDSEASFSQLLGHVTKSIMEAYDNQDCPFEMIIEDLPIQRGNGVNALFNTMLTFHGVKRRSTNYLHNETMQIKPYYIKKYSAPSSLKVDIRLSDSGEILISMQYDKMKFSSKRMQMLGEHFINIANEVVGNPEKRLSEINILSEKEKKQIVHDYNNTQKDYQRNTSISQLFESQVEKTPDNIAVAFEEGYLTYRELNRKANKVAWYLRDKGVEQNVVVGIMLERSPELIISILGVLKAGAA